MYTIDEIRQVHLEISSLCNAECPLCPRNFFGYPLNRGYAERNLTLEEIKKIFQIDFIKQLDEVLINGNFGDIVMNPQALEIIEYFRKHNPRCKIDISTNGGARNQEFWKDLARLNCRVYFCLEGLTDTHSLYRKNTRFETVINNAKTFIEAGGDAVWKMIKFDHNQHQIEDCQKLSKELGFNLFILNDHGRNVGPVFDNQGQLLYVIGKPVNTNFKEIYKSFNEGTIEFKLEDWFVKDKTYYSIDCQVKKRKSVYVTSEGEVYPCCFMGFAPRTYCKKPFKTQNLYQAINAQLNLILQENNALERPLSECIGWFNKVEESWNKPNFESGRLMICDYTCENKK